MSSSKLSREAQCTSRCRSLVHADDVLSALTKGGSEEEEVVISYIQWLCSNHAQLTDRWGRTALHVAASCGKGKIVRWLLAGKSCKGHVRDWESGWTPLHRSLYYGQLYAANILLESGANLGTADHDSLTPINLVMKDRPPYVDYRSAGVNEVYVWGTNHNYNLGLGSPQSRSSPESLDAFRKENVNIERIVMRKFHTLFLSRGGQIYVCGHGQRGRLGLPVEKTVLKPQPLKTINKEVCIQIAAGTDHIVLLMESGSVWTCGSNEHHLLGHQPPPEMLFTPKMITGIKNVIGICAGRFHTVVCLKELVYTFGLNAGQLGHPDQGDHLQTAPRIVASLSKQSMKFLHVAASHAATVCVTTTGEVFVLHEYQCRKIASKQMEVSKLIVCGGTLDSKVCPELIKDGGGTELRILLLTSIGQILFWTETCPQLTRCIFSINRSLRIIDAELFNGGVILATAEGEGFVAAILPPKGKKQEQHPESPRVKPMAVSDFSEWIERDECFQLKLKRLPNVHRAVSVACDHKGRNFSILQAHPKASLHEIPQLSPSQMKSDMKSLFLETQIGDGVQDCIIKIGKTEVPAHRFILASRCRLFAEMIAKSMKVLTVDNVNPSVLNDVVEFLYTDTCRWLKEGEVVFSPKVLSNSSQNTAPDLIASAIKKEALKKKLSGEKSAPNTLKLFREAAKRLELQNLEKRLEGVAVFEGKIQIVDPFPSTTLKFDRSKMSALCDVNITCSDGVIINCHKCILIARSDYFRGMLAGSVWSETSSSFTLPIPGDIMDNVIDCLYGDKAPKLAANDDVEFICNVLVTADQLLLSTLKELCEIRLADLLTLKNATELLEISWIYNATQLKASAMQFVGLNLPAMLEMKSLSSLSDEILIELTKNYRELIPKMCYRVITPYENGPTLDEMRMVHQMYPVNLHSERAEAVKEKRKTRTPRKSFSKKEDPVARTSAGGILETSSSSIRLSDSESSQDGSAMMAVSPLSQSFTESLSSLKLSRSQCSSSPPTPVWLRGAEDMDDAFPDLLCEVKSGSTDAIEKIRSPNDTFRNWGKLSQRERKKLQTAPIPIPNALFKENLLKKPNAWGRETTLSNEAPQLSDTMQVQWNPLKKLERSVSVPEAPHHASSIEETISPWGGAKIGKGGSTSNSSKVQNGNPPKTSIGKSCFANILLEEKLQADYLAKCQSKPLRLIQLEDQAIEDLITFYQARDNPEEFVTVQRVLPRFTATPIWKPMTRQFN